MLVIPLQRGAETRDAEEDLVCCMFFVSNKVKLRSMRGNGGDQETSWRAGAVKLCIVFLCDGTPQTVARMCDMSMRDFEVESPFVSLLVCLCQNIGKLEAKCQQCSNQLSYSMTLIHSDGKSIPLRSISIVCFFLM